MQASSHSKRILPKLTRTMRMVQKHARPVLASLTTERASRLYVLSSKRPLKWIWHKMHMEIAKVSNHKRTLKQVLRHPKQKMQKTKIWMCSDRLPRLRLRHHASKGQSGRTQTDQPCTLGSNGSLPAAKPRGLLKKNSARRIRARTKTPSSALLVELKNRLRQTTLVSIRWFSRHPKANYTPVQPRRSRAHSLNTPHR